jgi:hypothetical protein
MWLAQTWGSEMQECSVTMGYLMRYVNVVLQYASRSKRGYAQCVGFEAAKPGLARFLFG